MVPVLERAAIDPFRIVIRELVAPSDLAPTVFFLGGLMIRRILQPTMMTFQAAQLADGIAGKGLPGLTGEVPV